jgi:abortive infection alpha-like protein
VAYFLDRFQLVERTADVARFWLNVTKWTEEQLRHRLDDVVPPASTPEPAAEPTAKPDESTTLSSKMRELLDRALDQSTRGSQVELFHHILDQLVADEARIIGALSDGSASPLVNVHAWARPRVPGRAVLENASLIGRSANLALPAMVPTYVGHLLSLGLVETGPEDPDLKVDYEVLMAESMVLQAIKSASRGPLTAKVDKLTLRLSGLGQSFWAATMQPDAL